MRQRKLLSSSVLVVRAVGIGTTLLLLFSASGMGRITVVDHDNMEVSNLHWQVVLTKGRRGTIKARSTRNAMRALKPTISVMAVMDTLTWENTIELLNVNNCVVDAINNPHTQYLINNVYILLMPLVIAADSVSLSTRM